MSRALIAVDASTYIRVRLVDQCIEQFNCLPDAHTSAFFRFEVDAGLDVKCNSLLLWGARSVKFYRLHGAPVPLTVLLFVKVLDAVTGGFVVAELSFVDRLIEFRLVVPDFAFEHIYCDAVSIAQRMRYRA